MSPDKPTPVSADYGRYVERPNTRTCSGNARHHVRQSGFTLVEMLITLLILPILIGAASFSLIALMRGQTTVSNRVNTSADAQVVSASYFNDFESAQFLTMNSPATAATASPTDCVPPSFNSSDTWLLGLEVLGPSGGPTDVISYGEIPSANNGVTTTYSLVRWECTWDNNASDSIVYLSTKTLAVGLPIQTLRVQLNGLSCSLLAGTCLSSTSTPTIQASALVEWISTYGMSSVTLTGLPGASGTWSYTLWANPRNWIHIVKCDSSSGFCVTPQYLDAPGLDVGVNQSPTPGAAFNGNGCSIISASDGLNMLLLKLNGQSNPFSTNPAVTSNPVVLWGQNGGAATSGPTYPVQYGHGTGSGTLTINLGATGDPIANSNLTPSSSNFLSTMESFGFNIIQYISSWPTTYNSGTIYVVTNSSLTQLPAINMGATSSNGTIGSIFIWDTVNTTSLSVNGQSTPLIDLGPAGVLYAPNAVLNLNGNSQLYAANVITANLACNGQGSLTLNSPWNGK